MVISTRRLRPESVLTCQTHPGTKILNLIWTVPKHLEYCVIRGDREMRMILLSGNVH